MRNIFSTGKMRSPVTSFLFLNVFKDTKSHDYPKTVCFLQLQFSGKVVSPLDYFVSGVGA